MTKKTKSNEEVCTSKKEITKLSKSIEIFSRRYKIKYMDEIPYDGSDGNGVVNGEIDYGDKTICISTQQDKYDMELALFHEVIHGISHALRLCINGKEDEQLVQNLAFGILTVLEQNNWKLGSGFKRR